MVSFLLPTPVHAAGDRYWVNDGGNWDNTSHWSTTSGNTTGGASVPTSAESVHFDNLSFTMPNQTVIVNVTANCLNMDWTGATNSPTLAGSSDYNVYGNLTFIAAMTYSHSGNINMSGSGAQSITTNALAITTPTSLTIVGTVAQVVTLQDNLNLGAKTIYVNQMTFDVNGKTVTARNFLANTANAKTITLGAATINLSNTWDMANGGGAVTLTANTATINISGTGAFTGNSLTTYNSVNLNGTAHSVTSSFSCVNFTRNGTATKTDSLTLTSGITVTVTGTCALIGNSAVNRLLVQSSTLGTAAALHVTTDVAANWTGTNAVDFMDITSTHAVDLSAAGLNPAAYSGDCGGNTGITCTASDAQTSASTASWATVAGWTGTVISRVPLPQDDVTCSHSKTVDMPRIGRSIIFTGTPTISLSNVIENYGSFTLVSGMTYTHSSKLLNIRGRSNFTIANAGKDLYSLNFYAPNSTYTCTLSSTATSGNSILYNGSVVINGQTCTFSTFGIVVGASLDITNSVITLNRSGTAYPIWNCASTSITTTGSTIICSNAGVNTMTFAGNSQTYNNVTVQGAGAYALTVSGNNTFNSFTTTANVSTVNLTGNNTFTTLTMNRTSAAKILTLTAGTNQIVTDLICEKSDGRWLTINATAPATLTKAGGGALGYTYIDLAQNTGMPINTWYYTPVSVIGANVTNWILDAPPTVETIAPSVVGTTTATGRGNVTSLNFGGNINEQGIWYDVDSGVPYANSSNSTVDVGIGVFTQPLVGLTRSTLYYFRSHATNDDGYAEGVESTFLTKPVEPNTFTCTTVNASAISCNWTKGDGALNTYIRYSNVTYPTTTADGTFGYNGTLSTYIQTGLTDATVYYFRGWSWVSNATLSQYSDLYAGNYTITSDPPQLATIPASNVEETTATTSATITYSPANYTVWGTQYGLTGLYGTWSNITGISSTVPYGFNNNLVGLAKGDLYYFRGFAQNVAGIGYGSQLTFLTKPDEPTNLSVVNNAHSSTLSWVKGTGALNTVIYGKANSYPTAIGDGTLVYNGTLATTSFVPGFSVETWYYRAWSLAQEGGLSQYSDTYAESNAQGRMSDWARLLIVTVFLACMIMGLLWVMFATPVSSNVIALMFTLVTFALIAFMGVAIINALL
jgi:hypothetical protein